VKNWPIIALTLSTLGSGLFNLYSALGHGGHLRIERLRPFFPLEFIHYSHSVTLVAGFVMVMSSFSIYKRKRRAFWLVIALCVASVLAHDGRGFHGPAAMSTLVLGLLLVERDRFTVRSREFDWRSALATTCLGRKR
jgi:lysylphosphatidylglycerol synthetase-like protein (DUF2156 family)